MRTLAPHQQNLLRLLTSDPPPRATLVRAPVGAGTTEVLVRLAGQVAAAGGLVLVVTTHQVIVEHWADRLDAADLARAVILPTSSELLVVLDETGELGLPTAGVVLATVRRLVHGAARRAAEMLTPNLLIVDDVSANLKKGQAREVIQALVARSTQVVVAVHPPAATPEWLGASHTVDISLHDVLRSAAAGLELQIGTYSVSSEEIDLFDRAISLVRESVGALPIRVATRPALHRTLMRIATRLSGDDLEVSETADADAEEFSSLKATPARQAQLAEALWDTADALEALGDDGRLALTADLVRAAIGDQRHVLITTDRIDEAEYVGAHLRAQGLPVHIVSGATRPSERRRVVDRFAAGEVLIVTHLVQQALELPSSTTSIWWSPPRTAVQAVQRVGLGDQSSRTIVILSEPPLPDDQAFRTTVLRALVDESDIRTSPAT
jgi:superfamily II DNA or RNA helicase